MLALSRIKLGPGTVRFSISRKSSETHSSVHAYPKDLGGIGEEARVEIWTATGDFF